MRVWAEHVGQLSNLINLRACLVEAQLTSDAERYSDPTNFMDHRATLETS